MAKIQETNNALQSLTLDKYQSKMQMKEYTDRNNELERIIASGEAKLRNLALQLSKSVAEQERLIRAEAELKMQLASLK